MKKLTTIMLAVLLMSGMTHAVEHGKFGISGEVRALTSNSRGFVPGETEAFDTRFWEPNTMIGFRYFAGEKIGLELRFGLEKMGAVDLDTASQTLQEPSYHSFAFEIGGMYRAFETPRSYIGVIGRLGFISNQLNRFIRCGEHWGNANEQRYEEYKVTTTSIFIGFEPSYFFNDHFSIYSTFGLRIKKLPETKYVEQTGWDHAAYLAAKLKDRKDSRTLTMFDGVWIGMRYCP